jgi:hypothetical protein
VQHGVDGVQQALPVVAAVDLPPPRGQLPIGAPGRLRQGAALHVPDHGGLRLGHRRGGDDAVASATALLLLLTPQSRSTAIRWRANEPPAPRRGQLLEERRRPAEVDGEEVLLAGSRDGGHG